MDGYLCFLCLCIISIDTMTKQLEFKFFWPLTEQIPLDLDYTGCATKISIAPSSYGSVSFINAVDTDTRNTAIVLDTNQIVIRTDIKLGFIRRLMYKLMGFKWEYKN